MRDSNKTVQVKEMTEVTKDIETEEIQTIAENKVLQRVELTIAYRTSNGEVAKVDYVLIDGDYYTLLMSESPAFAPGKPANEYREIDLWYIVDQITIYGEGGGQS
ncbi:hypothetical protein [Paenibacillus kobensis]|uniref:hypothetical protein n=1 Tax=Paenibacillus kobensis TaxID=59841 RepID=UPI000FD8A828|nr:hypothetical protein [Paenibacillus kobensis]